MRWSCHVFATTAFGMACNGPPAFQDSTSSAELPDTAATDGTEDAAVSSEVTLDSTGAELAHPPLDGAPSTDGGTDSDLNDSMDGPTDTTTDDNPDSKIDGAPCDLDSLCKTNGTWQDGVCIGDPVTCDDQEPCTQDVCWDRTGCVHVWTPGCGGRPCGDCPEDLGFACVPNGSDGMACINASTEEAYVPGGIFRFGHIESSYELVPINKVEWYQSKVEWGHIAPAWIYTPPFIFSTRLN